MDLESFMLFMEFFNKEFGIYGFRRSIDVRLGIVFYCYKGNVFDKRVVNIVGIG